MGPKRSGLNSVGTIDIFSGVFQMQVLWWTECKLEIRKINLNSRLLQMAAIIYLYISTSLVISSYTDYVPGHGTINKVTVSWFGQWGKISMIQQRTLKSLLTKTFLLLWLLGTMKPPSCEKRLMIYWIMRPQVFCLLTNNAEIH